MGPVANNCEFLRLKSQGKGMKVGFEKHQFLSRMAAVKLKVKWCDFHKLLICIAQECHD